MDYSKIEVFIDEMKLTITTLKAGEITTDDAKVHIGVYKNINRAIAKDIEDTRLRLEHAKLTGRLKRGSADLPNYKKLD